MTVETTIQEMFDKYPDMYSTRRECFDQLFCVIGNGYRWKWGQLVYVGDMNGISEKEEKAKHDADYAREFHIRAHQSKKNIKSRQKKNAIFAKDRLIGTGKYDWYPLSKKYSKLFRIPADAKQDWKDAVEECKKMLEQDGVDWKNAPEV